jgi:proteasome lid subunit RPN8/RPN11
MWRAVNPFRQFTLLSAAFDCRLVPMLCLSTAQLQQIYDHAQRSYPEECCGMLLGNIQADGTQVLLEVWETRNAWSAEAAEAIAALLPASADDSSTGDRYWIDPQELLKVQRYGRDRQLAVIGIYHSHPDHPAVPSECDRVMAWSGYCYGIVSVQQGRAIDWKAWRLDEQQQFQPEDLVMLESSSTSFQATKISNPNV